MPEAFTVDPDHLPAPEPRPRRVLVTGAAGRIGSNFARHARDRYDLTLMVQPGQETEAIRRCGHIVQADLADLDRLKQLLPGMDTVVHLAANPSGHATWDELLPNNIVGTYNLFVAAIAAGCRRVVFASSVHAVSGYPPDVQIKPQDPVNPGDVYGLSKCFGEAMGRYASTQHDLSVIVIRIGAYLPLDAARDPHSLNAMPIFISHRDMNQLLERTVDNEDLAFAIVHGASGNRFNRMDISSARELLGYEPQDDYTQEHPTLKQLNLAGTIHPNDEHSLGSSGIRNQL